MIAIVRSMLLSFAEICEIHHVHCWQPRQHDNYRASWLAGPFAGAQSDATYKKTLDSVVHSLAILEDHLNLARKDRLAWLELIAFAEALSRWINQG